MFIVNVMAAPPDAAAVVSLPPAVVSVTLRPLSRLLLRPWWRLPLLRVSLEPSLLSLPQDAAMNARPTARAA